VNGAALSRCVCARRRAGTLNHDRRYDHPRRRGGLITVTSSRPSPAMDGPVTRAARLMPATIIAQTTRRPYEVSSQASYLKDSDTRVRNAAWRRGDPPAEGKCRGAGAAGDAAAGLLEDSLGSRDRPVPQQADRTFTLCVD
jgi:hypothetical protein